MVESFPSALPPVVEIRRLTRRFGSTTALDDVSLSIPRGGVFGLIGENGAGKTTLIKHILGMFKAQAGSVCVFGLDPVQNPVGTLGRIGYLSEDRDLPDWMRVGELMHYTQAFFPTWDEAFAEELREMFDLGVNAKIKTLSRGQRARAGLLAALAHRPELLVLDEPSSGLDPITA
jgi:ABC-2 type transport system ATP-binding protein